MINLYKTTRKVEHYTFNEEEFLKWLKKENPNDSDIQNLKTFDDIEKEWGISEFGGEIDTYLSDYCIKGKELLDSSISYYDNYGDAFDEMEWGIH